MMTKCKDTILWKTQNICKIEKVKNTMDRLQIKPYRTIVFKYNPKT